MYQYQYQINTVNNGRDRRTCWSMWRSLQCDTAVAWWYSKECISADMTEESGLQILENPGNVCLERNSDDMNIIILSHYSWKILTWTNVWTAFLQAYDQQTPQTMPFLFRRRTCEWKPVQVTTKTDFLTHWGREGSFKLFKRPLPGFFLTILTL